MIGTYSLTLETKAIADLIENSIIESKNELAKHMEKFCNEVYDTLHNKIESHLAYDNAENFKLTIAYEVRNIMKNLLVGDLSQIKDLSILSEYTFDRLHEIRIKMWETCGEEIEKSIITEMHKQIIELKRQVENYRRRDNY